VTGYHQVLCGKPPYWDMSRNVVYSILEGTRPTQPAELAALGFTDGLWWIVECCWMEDREMRPGVKTVLASLTDAAWAWDMRR
jgi:hypothetical protein